MTCKYPNKIHAIKAEKGWTWKYITDRIFGTKQNHIYAIADGKQAPSIETVVRMEALFGMPFSEIYAEWYEKERVKAVELINNADA